MNRFFLFSPNTYCVIRADDGLPCVDFEVANDKICKCDGGLEAIITKYTGENSAERLVFYVGDEELCMVSF